MSEPLDTSAECLWSHHCFQCETLFDAADLDSACPACGCKNRRETMSTDPELKRFYGIQKQEDWPGILALEDFTNPRD